MPNHPEKDLFDLLEEDSSDDEKYEMKSVKESHEKDTMVGETKSCISSAQTTSQRASEKISFLKRPAPVSIEALAGKLRTAEPTSDPQLMLFDKLVTKENVQDRSGIMKRVKQMPHEKQGILKSEVVTKPETGEQVRTLVLPSMLKLKAINEVATELLALQCLSSKPQ